MDGGEPPKTLAIVISLALLAIPVSGLLWLLARRCQLGLGQFLAGLFSYAAVLAVLNAAFSDDRPQFIGLALCAALTMGLGLYFGALMGRPYTGWRRWHYFLCGLLLPYAVPAFPVSLLGLVAPTKHPTGFYVTAACAAVASGVVIGSVVYRASQKSQGPD